MLEGEPLGDISPSWGTGWPGTFVRWLPISLMSFTSSPRKWFSRKSQRWGLCRQHLGPADPKGPGLGSSFPLGQLLWHPRLYPHLSWENFCASQRICRHPASCSVPSCCSSAKSLKKRQAPSRTTSHSANRHPERGKCRKPAEAG